MTQLQQQLEKALAFDHSQPWHELGMYGKKGAETENSRLAPLHKILIEAVGALEEQRKFAPIDGWHFSDCPKADDETDGCTCGSDAVELKTIGAITKLREHLEKM